MSERRDVIRTKRNVEKAYVELLFEKGDERITVGDILEKADISRGTFYAHYKDISDLAEKVEENLIDQWKNVVSSTSMEKIVQNPIAEVERFADIFEHHRESLGKILKNNGSPKLVAKLKRIIVEGIYRDLYAGRKVNKPVLTLSGAVFAGMLVDAGVEWVTAENPVTRAEFVALLCAVISGSAAKLKSPELASTLRYVSD